MSEQNHEQTQTTETVTQERPATVGETFAQQLQNNPTAAANPAAVGVTPAQAAAAPVQQTTTTETVSSNTTNKQ